METKVLKIDEGLDYAVKLLKDGEVVAFPTETVYGLGADCTNADAVEKIFLAKGRPQDNPLIVHIAKIEDVKEVAREIPDVFYTLANKFLPGPLTIILKKSDKVSPVVTAGRDTVGVRMPSNEIARKIVEKSGVFMAAPSANSSKHISPTTAKHVFDDLNGKIPLIIDGGSCEVGIESTILDLTMDTPTILRPGAITQEMLKEVLSEVAVYKSKNVEVALAPGMKYKHYAPKVPAVMKDDVSEVILEYKRVVKEGKRPVIIGKNHVEYFFLNLINIGNTGEEYARNVYDALHKAEENYDYVIVEKLEDEGVSRSVMNRLLKATKNEK